MAEELRMWSRRHVHESSTVSYGQLGTPTYHSSLGDWDFLRQDGPARADDENLDTLRNDQESLNIFSEAEKLVEGTTPDVELQSGHPLAKNLAEVTAAASLIKSIGKTRHAGNSISHQGHLIALGSAVWLNSEAVDSGNSTVPVTAFVTGSTSNILQLACLGREQIEYIPEHDTGRKLRVPSLISDLRTSISGSESISQVSFSQQDIQGKGDTFMLVRQLNRTTICEPLLHRDASSRSPAQERSYLDLNPLVTLDTSVTGGCTHVNAMFHPLNHRVFAIVDEEGNWSTWKVSGRRSTTVRVLYQARLGSSGKIFSWKHDKRPEGIGPVFDGWHKVVWLSSDGQRIDRLLVCNRRKIRLFNTAGEDICSIDARLENGNGMYILDVQIGPVLNVCFVLTTSRVLVFDLKQREWKDPANDKGPLLMGAFQHFRNLMDRSLRMTHITLGNKTLVGLYSTGSKCLGIRPLLLSRKNDVLSITISDTQSMNLPITPLSSKARTIVLAQSEHARIGGDPIAPDKKPVCVIVQCEDLSIYSFWAMATNSNRVEGMHAAQTVLKLPPTRSVHSNRYVDVTRDDEDDEAFLILDHERDVLWPKKHVTQNLDLAAVVARSGEMKKVSILIDTIDQHRTFSLPQSSVNIVEMLQSFEAHLHGTNSRQAMSSSCTLLADLLINDVKVQDIEAVSDAVQQALNNQIQTPTSYTISTCHGKSTQTLLSTYRSLFDTFVESLPADAPDRFRVHKERQDRRIALEQYLSNHIVHAAPEEKVAGLDGRHEAADNSQMIFSDPMLDAVFQDQHIQSISASQPAPSAKSELKKPDVKAYPLIDSISRLQTYAKISRDVASKHLSGSTASEHILSVLAHLPASYDGDPHEYDYQGTMMTIAADKAESMGGDNGTSRAQRKAARLARVRKRAEASTPMVDFLISEVHDKEVGNDSRDAESRNEEMLPIRVGRGKIPGTVSHAGFGQSQDRHAFSNGHMPAQSSSQAAAYGGFTHTQPERGAFASRFEPNSQNKSKKKRRVAGF